MVPRDSLRAVEQLSQRRWWALEGHLPVEAWKEPGEERAPSRRSMSGSRSSQARCKWIVLRAAHEASMSILCIIYSIYKYYSYLLLLLSLSLFSLLLFGCKSLRLYANINVSLYVKHD